MAGNAKWKGGVGLARATSASESVASPDFYIPCETAQIAEAPIVWARMPNFVPDKTHHGHGGFNYTWSISGITAPIDVLGFLLWSILGADAFSTPNHTLTPADDLPWLNVFVDTLQDISSDASSKPTKRAIGAKATSLKGVWEMGGWAKFDISGVACDLGAPLAALTPTIATGADYRPASWEDLEDASGYLEIGLSGAATAQDDLVRKVSFELARPAIMYGKGVGSRQPTAIDHGTRELKVEIEKDFFGSLARPQYQEFRGQGYLELAMLGVISANKQYDIAFPRLEIMDSVEQGVGTDQDVVQAKFSLEGGRDGSAALMTAIIKESAVADYDTL